MANPTNQPHDAKGKSARSAGAAARPVGAVLDNNAVNASTPDLSTPDLRSLRWAARAAVQRVSHRSNVQKCGRCRYSNVVELRSADGRASFSGVVSCGAVWLCPPCNAKIAAYRALEVAAVTQQAVLEGRPMLFGALTLRHDQRARLDTLLDLQRAAWRMMTTGRAWQELKVQAGGILDHARTLEINHGDNGWHPHWHPLFVLAAGVSEKQAEQIAALLVARWVACVAAIGGTAEVAAQSLHLVRNAPAVGAYISDQTFGGKTTRVRVDLEMTAAQNKSGMTRAGGTRSHWGIIEDLWMGIDLHRSKALYAHLEAFSYRVRQLTWSRNLRTWAGLGADKSDDDVAAAAEGLAVAQLTPAGWDELAKKNLALRTLQTFERSGMDAVTALWDSAGVEYLWANGGEK